MKLGVMQPYLCPYIGYWQLIHSVDKFVIYDDVNFIKCGWINRNRILSNGQATLWGLSLSGASSYKKINELSIQSNNTLKQKMLRSITHSYKKSPHFEDIFPLVEKIIMFENATLSEFVTHSIIQISRYIDLETEFLISSEIDKNNDLNGQDKIIDICKRLGATEYINATGGQELYDGETFKQNNLQLLFIDTPPFAYQQFKNEFIPNLSIIDVLMFNSLEEVKKMVSNYSVH